MSEVLPSIVVIGYNEADQLHDCLLSAAAARDAGQAGEIIYVDGGSTDESRTIAESYHVDAVLGGSVRRSAAVNRNVGWRHAQSPLIQFLDADMVLDRNWLTIASARLTADPDCAVVCGAINERRQSIWSRVFQLDWHRSPGPIAYCGGAALMRRAALDAVNGFPEDVAYGEEPLLCWRIRNDVGHTIEYLDASMVTHDLAFRGFKDYWQRCKRVGETQAAIATRCWHTPDPLWRRETLRTLFWVAAYVVVLVTLAAAPVAFKAAAVGAVGFVLLRKMAQSFGAGQSPVVASLYALHTYFAKIPIAIGMVRWWLSRSRSTPDTAHNT